MSGVINGERVSLREITLADTASIVRWRNSENVLKYFIDRTPITPESHERWLKERVETGRVAQFIIVDNAGGADVGTAFLRDIDKANGAAEFGFFIGEEGARGRGLGGESCSLLCAYAFNELGLRRVTARVLAFNTRSAAVFERAGFKKEGAARERIVCGDGCCDVVFYSLTKEDFNG